MQSDKKKRFNCDVSLNCQYRSDNRCNRRYLYESILKSSFFIATLGLMWSSISLSRKKSVEVPTLQVSQMTVYTGQMLDTTKNPPNSPLKLRFDWTNLEPLSVLAKNISLHQQTRCNLPLANFRYRNRFGLGSDLHVWSQAICNGMELGVRIRTQLPWIWLHNESCKHRNITESGDNEQHLDKHHLSSMVCYFPHSELKCPNDVWLSNDTDQFRGIIQHNLTRGRGRIKNECPSLVEMYGISEIRAAAIEFLFTKVSPIIQNESQRQLRIVFGNVHTIPKHLITVHIRWGDKDDEMLLVPVSEYIDAVVKLIETRSIHEVDDTVNIFLATEDPRAVEEFTKAARKDWIIYLDASYHELKKYRKDEYNGNPRLSSELNGKPGLIALGSLLVAMEANYFVLTTSSNWSRLINELRKNILNPRCDNCTEMIDLRYGEW